MSLMKAFRCSFCGDVYMGDQAPSHCPYCGAPARFIAANDLWQAPVIPELSQKSQENLERALQLEVNNTQFYRNVGGSEIAQEWQGIFKYLARMEGEHAGTIRKALKSNDMPEPNEDVSAKDSLQADLSEVIRRETRASKFYHEALAEATEERVRQIFSILIEIEGLHLELGQSNYKG